MGFHVVFDGKGSLFGGLTVLFLVDARSENVFAFIVWFSLVVEVKFVLLCHLHDCSWFLVEKRMFFVSVLSDFSWKRMFLFVCRLISVSILTILKDLMKPCKTWPASQSKQVEMCSRQCLSVSEYDWSWKRTYAHLRRNSLAHGLNDLNQTIKRF